MFIYGTKAAKLTIEPIADVCSNCGTRHTMDVHVFARYRHVLGIPIFPTRKTGATQCNYCKQVLRRKDMPVDLLQTFNKVKCATNMPVWTWSGLLAAVVFAACSLLID